MNTHSLFLKKRVLVVPEYDNFGGTLTFFKKLMGILKNNGFEIGVLITQRQKFPEVIAFCEKMNAQIFVIPNRDKRYMKSWIATIYEILFGLKAILKFKPDILHISCGGYGNMLGFLLFRRPLIFTLLSRPFGRIKMGRNILFQLFKSPKKQLTCDSRTSAVALSETVDLPLNQIKVIHNSYHGTDTISTPESNYILTMGHFNSYKNPVVWFETAILVLKKCPDTKFIWLGEGDLIKEYKAKIQELGLSESLILEGYRSNISDYLQKTFVYFHPSLLESHGIAVIEAMAHGVPCVSSNAGGLKESIIDGETGYLFDPNDTQSFAEKIIYLLENADERDRLSINAVKHVKENFSDEKFESEFMDIYYSLLLSSSGNPIKH